jgi:hypothetical protein
MKFFKKGFAYNKLAKGFNGVYVMLNELEVKVKNNEDDIHQDFFIIAYLSRRDILDSIDEYGWVMGSPIIVPMMSQGRLTLMFAYQQTIGRLIRLSNEVGISGVVEEILEKGNAYYEIDNALPTNIKNMLN